MALYEITADHLAKITETSFDLAGVRERSDLQRLLKKQIDVIAPETLVIAEEFGEWEESKRRIDLLGLDKNANLVVIELKRTDDGGHMELQAIRYAAMVSAMTFEQAVDVYSRYLPKTGSTDDARERILGFLGWEEPNEDLFAQDVRIVLVSANFSKELTTAVMWLNKRDLDVRCIRLLPYIDNGRVLIDVHQVIPLPEAIDYIVQIKEKEQKERKDRAERSTFRRFWEGLLALARPKTELHAHISPSDQGWISTGSHDVYYSYNISQHEGRVELYFGHREQPINKRRFDELRKHENEINATFGAQLSWQRLDLKKACRVAQTIDVGGYRDDEAKWPEIQKAMIDAMIRLEAATAPYVAILK